MSRIGVYPVIKPDDVQVSINDSRFSITGKLGSLSQDYHSRVTFKLQDNLVYVLRKGESKQDRAYHGLYRSLLKNMVHGVTEGFTKTLHIVGVGYRAELKDQFIVFSLGYSAPIYFAIPEGISIKIEEAVRVKVSGIDKFLVGQTAAQIRSLRKPEPYKGKGVMYADEKLIRKEGKSGSKGKK